MASLRSKCCLVYDYGQFIELAVTLSKSFGRTLYYAPWLTGGNPTSNMLRVGQGIDGIERVTDIWPHIDDIDLFVFPDVYEAGLQEYLESIGKRVWGCRSGAELELDRAASKEQSKKLGIDIGPYKRIVGLDDLREHLKRNDDQWVKISRTRGDMETFHSPDYTASEQILDKLADKLGAKKKDMEFIVEQGIPDAIEAGYDGYTIDGKFAKEALIGVEVKCKAYLGKTMRYAQLPEAVRSVNEKLVPALKAYGYRGCISTEIRCKGDKAYLIDPCARCGSPPSEVYQVLTDNLAEIMYEGAEGFVVEPEFSAKYAAMVLLCSDWATENWQHVSFPPSIREKVKLHNFTMIDGEYYIVPHLDKRTQIGAVMGIGDTAKEAIADCKKTAEQVEGHGLEMPVDELDQAQEQLDDLIGPDKPVSALEQRAAKLMADGTISGKQYDRMIERG